VATALAAAARAWAGAGGSADAAKARDTLAVSKYIYSEDKHPELFFVPYAWALTVAYTPDLCWGDALPLFSAGGKASPLYSAGGAGGAKAQ